MKFERARIEVIQIPSEYEPFLKVKINGEDYSGMYRFYTRDKKCMEKLHLIMNSLKANDYSDLHGKYVLSLISSISGHIIGIAPESESRVIPM